MALHVWKNLHGRGGGVSSGQHTSLKGAQRDKRAVPKITMRSPKVSPSLSNKIAQTAVLVQGNVLQKSARGVGGG